MDCTVRLNFDLFSSYFVRRSKIDTSFCKLRTDVLSLVRFKNAMWLPPTGCSNGSSLRSSPGFARYVLFLLLSPLPPLSQHFQNSLDHRSTATQAPQPRPEDLQVFSSAATAYTPDECLLDLVNSQRRNQFSQPVNHGRIGSVIVRNFRNQLFLVTAFGSTTAAGGGDTPEDLRGNAGGGGGTFRG